MSVSENVHKAVTTFVCYHVTQETVLLVYKCFVFDVIAESCWNTLSVSSGHLLNKILVTIWNHVDKSAPELWVPIKKKLPILVIEYKFFEIKKLNFLKIS